MGPNNSLSNVELNGGLDGAKVRLGCARLGYTVRGFKVRVALS